MRYLAQLRQDRAFVVHLTVYLAVNLLLAIVSLGGAKMEYWFLWPLAGWGIGLIFHAYCSIVSCKRSSRSRDLDHLDRPTSSN